MVRCTSQASAEHVHLVMCLTLELYSVAVRWTQRLPTILAGYTAHCAACRATHLAFRMAIIFKALRAEVGHLARITHAHMVIAHGRFTFHAHGFTLKTAGSYTTV